MDLGSKLRSLRTQAGLSQQQLAVKAGMALTSIRNYETGRREPSWSGLFRLAQVLGVTAEVFAECLPNSPPAELPGAGSAAAEPAPPLPQAKAKAAPAERPKRSPKRRPKGT